MPVVSCDEPSPHPPFPRRRQRSRSESRGGEQELQETRCCIMNAGFRQTHRNLLSADQRFSLSSLLGSGDTMRRTTRSVSFTFWICFLGFGFCSCCFKSVLRDLNSDSDSDTDHSWCFTHRGILCSCVCCAQSKTPGKTCVVLSRLLIIKNHPAGPACFKMSCCTQFSLSVS